MTAASCVRSGWSLWDDWLEDPAPSSSAPTDRAVALVAPAWDSNRHHPVPRPGPSVVQGETFEAVVGAAVDALPMEEVYTLCGGRELGALRSPDLRAARCVSRHHDDGAAKGAPPSSFVMFLEERTFVCLGASCGVKGRDLEMASHLLGFGGGIGGHLNRAVLDELGARLGISRADFVDDAQAVPDDEIEEVLEEAMAAAVAGADVAPIAPVVEAAPTSAAVDLVLPQPDAEDSTKFDERMGRVDLFELLRSDPPEPDWLIAPLVPAGRNTSITAPAKAGKSLLTLEMVVCFAVGRAFLQMPAGPGRRVLYLDYEMGPVDLLERLLEFDLTAEEEARLVQNLVYLAFPPLLALGTVKGGQQLIHAVERYRPELVVFDTMSRIVEDENSNSDIQNLYAHSFLPLKRRGVATLRLDHTGHGDTSRARGGAAKQEDLDLAWTLKATDGGRVLTRTHQRISWAPEEVILAVRGPGGEGPIHRMVGGSALESYPEGTRACVDWLEAQDVPVGLAYRKVRSDYLEDPKVNPEGPGHFKAGNKALQAALRFRRAEAARLETGEALEEFLEGQDDFMDAAIPEDDE